MPRSKESGKRGVSWLYPLADAEGHACVVEAGLRLGSEEPFPYFDHVPAYYRGRLPGIASMARIRARYGTPAPVNGMLVRGRDYRLPEEYVRDWNEGLWKAFDRNWLAILKDLLGEFLGGAKGLQSWKDRVSAMLVGTSYSAAMFTERGVINRSGRTPTARAPSTLRRSACEGRMSSSPQITASLRKCA